MKPLYYTAHDISNLTGYSLDKAYKLIVDWNKEIEENYKDDEGNSIKTYKGRVAIWYFNKIHGINEQKKTYKLRKNS